jgi:hypothetical protein
MTDIIDRDVVVLAPEEGDGGKSLAVPEHVERSGLSLALGYHPMLDADALTAMWVGPACNVTGRPNGWRARFEIGIHDNTAINDKPSHVCKFGPRAHTDIDDHEIRLKRAAPLER